MASLSVPDEVSGWVLDVAALVALVDRTVYGATLVADAWQYGTTLMIPAGVFSATLGLRPDAGPTLDRLLDDPYTELADPADAPAEELSKLAEHLAGDRNAAHLVWLGSTRQWPILSDRGDYLRRAVPDLLILPA